MALPKAKRKCTDCGTELSHQSKSKGRCRKCYLKHKSETTGTAVCHPGERVMGHGLCKKCYHRARPMSPEVQRACHLRKAYGLSLEGLSEKIAAQNNQCAICQEALTKESDINVDHCHETGQVRGILCRWCNIGLGNFKDSIDFLQRAIGYLEGYRKREEKRNGQD